ncbi:trypsin-like serine peptidase [Phytohabitans sp. LJ34]|uniref:serine protease n=1 Tax=Phytohabitans sp. LJ34 TaxID=3452217 RepID=UPI003F8C2FF3
MSGPPAPWWDDPRTDWSAGEPGRVVDVLTYAYEDLAAIQAIAESVGLDWHTGPAAASARARWQWALTEAAGRGRALDLAAEVLHDPGSEAFHPPLRKLLGDRLAPAYARLAARHGLPPPPTEGTDPVVTSLVESMEEPGDQPVGGLEAITSVTAGLDDPRSLVQAILDAMARTAMIEVAGQPRGTGFLVGPDLLLTAAHVVGASPVLPADMVARFDYSDIPGRSLAETGTGIPVVELLAASQPTDAEGTGRVRDWNAPADRLDFALVKLGFPVPLAREVTPRGMYPLEETAYDFRSSPLLFITQHPLGQTQRVTWIRTPPECNQLGTRIRYRGNTLNGSSGSPVVDIRGRLVALHHYSQGGDNQAVPISCIAKAICDGPYASLLSAAAPVSPAVVAPTPPAPVDIDPLRTTSVGGRPLVNRGGLRDRVRTMTAKEPANRVLAITGESGSGVSYSFQFLQHVAERAKLSAPIRKAAPDGLVAIQINLSNYIGLGIDTRRERIIDDLLIGLELPYPKEQLAQDARTISTLQMWLTTKLRDSPRQWWIFIDSVNDTTAAKQGGLDELIHALVTVADDPRVPLRLVLAGRDAERFALEHSQWLEQDTAIGLARSEVEAWFRARAVEEGGSLDEASLATQLDTLFPVGGPLPEPRKLAPRLPALLFDVLGARDGS